MCSASEPLLPLPWRWSSGIRKPLYLWKNCWERLSICVCAYRWFIQRLKKGNILTLVPLIRTLQVGKIAEAQCISHCNCFDSTISPVCGSNGVTYLSSCFAGCTSRNSQEPAGRSGSSIIQVSATLVTVISLFFLMETFLLSKASSGYFFL